MALTDPSRRLQAMPPYMFAELEKKIADKRAAGIDVISLGIGDPDHPTYPHVVKAMQEAVADRGNQNYPSNRGREEFRRAFSDFYRDRFGVGIDPETEVIPAIGAKECIYNLCFAFLDPGDAAAFRPAREPDDVETDRRHDRAGLGDRHDPLAGA